MNYYDLLSVEMNPANNEEVVNLVVNGDIEYCPMCGALNAYAWEYVTINPNTGGRWFPEDGLSDGGELYTDEEIKPDWPDVYHIPAASGFEWQCGKCRTSFTTHDSPINQPCYTHSED